MNELISEKLTKALDFAEQLKRATLYDEQRANTTADEINFDIDRKFLFTFIDDLKELLKELDGLVENE